MDQLKTLNYINKEVIVMKSLATVLCIALAGILLLGVSSASAQALGDRDQLVYKPVNPCRIVDTRFAGGPFAAEEVRFYDVYGNVTAQNGANAGNQYPNSCRAPKGEPSAVAINVTAVPNQGFSGHLRVQPGFLATQIVEASMVNFTAGENVANQGAVRTRVAGAGQPDIKIYASVPTNVVVDVAGYYYDVEDVFIDEDFNSGGGFAVGPSLAWLAPIAQVEVTRANQNIFVFSEKAFGSTHREGAGDLDLNICYSTTATPDNAAGAEVRNIRVQYNTRVIQGLSALIIDPGVGLWNVALCGDSSEHPRWNSNSRGRTTAFVVEDKQ
jgi:hypothetical protein